MSKGSNLITKIILKGQTDPSLQKAFQQANKQADSSLNKLKKYGETASKVMKAGAVAVVAGLGASAKSAIDYESAFAGVMKTVDETATTTYADLSESIRNMAKEMPASASEIAQVAEVAGQLGIKADDIAGFTKTMINLGETTNLTSEDAASSIAKFFNITQTGMGNVDEFGATLVALGNNAATTESDILNMASRIASSGSMIGLSNQEILALATSLSSVGLEAEGGGTAISTVLSQIDKQVATSGEELSTWASLAGMSAGEFKKAWQTDTMGTIQKVVTGMGDAKAGGKNLNIILDELGIKGIRTSDTMKRLTNASGLMADMTDLANKSWSENTALTKEANTRYATMASKIQIFKNKLTDVAITVGNSLMPAMDKLLEVVNAIDWEGVANKITNALQWISDHSTVLIGILGALGGAFVGVKILGFVTTIIQVVKWVSGLIKVFGFMKVALTALGGPVTIVVAIIGALVGAFIVLWKKSDTFRNFWINLWNGIKNVASIVGNWLKNFFTVTVPNAFNSLVEKCKTVGNAIKNFFTVTIPNAFNKVVTFFQELPSKIWTWLLGVVTKINNFRNMLLQKAIEIGTNFVNKVISFFQKLPYYIGYVIGFVIGKIVLFGQKLWNFATVTVPQFISKVVNWFKQLPSRIWTWLTNTISKITAWGSRMIAIGRQKALQFLNAVVNYVKNLPSRIWTWLTNTVNKVISWGARMVSIGRQKATQFINAVINYVKTLPSKIWTWLVNTAQKVVAWGTQLASKGKAAAVKLYNAIVDKVKEIPKKMLEFGKNIVKGLWNGIKNAKDWLVGKIKSFAGGITDGFASALGIHSPSAVMEKLFKWVPVGAGEGIIKNAKYAVNAVKTMGGKVAKASAQISPTIQTKVATVGNKIRAFGNGGTVSSPEYALIGDKTETIVPHGNTPRNRSLLSEAARGVGASIGNSISITFAPVINGGNAEDNRRMLLEEEEAFERKMDEYFEKKVRLAF